MSILIETYSEKAIVVRNTLEHHGQFMTELGGTFNEKLKGGRGWIFSKFKFGQVKNIVDKLNSGQYGNEFEKKTETSGSNSNSSGTVSHETVSKSEYLSLLSRVERLEALVSSRLGSVEQQTEQKTVKMEQKTVKMERSPTPDMDEEEEYVPKKRLVQMRK
jgi:hypothetical protein